MPNRSNAPPDRFEKLIQPQVSDHPKTTVRLRLQMIAFLELDLRFTGFGGGCGWVAGDGGAVTTGLGLLFGSTARRQL
jgi:hypothetical protein